MQLVNTQVTRDTDAWEAEIKAEIPAELLASYRDTALKEIQKTAKLDGFREGKAPVDRILQVYGEAAVMRHAAQMAIEGELPLLLAKESLPIVEAPRVTTDTPEQGKSLVFTARAALAPDIKTGDYKAIAERIRATGEDTSVSDAEHAEALLHLRRERARIEKLEAGAEPAKAVEESKSMKEEELPAIDDAFVQSLGYADTAAFTDALRTNIASEKENRAREKKRAAILDELVSVSTVSYPKSLLDYELQDIEARLKDDLSRMGQTIEGYLVQMKKTREELVASWKEPAEKRVKVRLILSDIARTESIEPSEENVLHELEHAKQHYPDADPVNLRANIAHAMRNEMTLRFLETGTVEQLPLQKHDHAH
jgi:FKBP-type peptidyl-prolyl cis-trans isomerase (trigger factor)